MNNPQVSAEKSAKEKTYKIFVNTREKTVDKDILSYDEVVILAFGSVPTDPDIIVTVLYEHADQKPDEGKLVKGQSVKIKNNTRFDVSQTNRS